MRFAMRARRGAEERALPASDAFSRDDDGAALSGAIVTDEIITCWR